MSPVNYSAVVTYSKYSESFLVTSISRMYYMRIQQKYKAPNLGVLYQNVTLLKLAHFQPKLTYNSLIAKTCHIFGQYSKPVKKSGHISQNLSTHITIILEKIFSVIPEKNCHILVS